MLIALSCNMLLSSIPLPLSYEALGQGQSKFDVVNRPPRQWQLGHSEGVK